MLENGPPDAIWCLGTGVTRLYLYGNWYQGCVSEHVSGSSLACVDGMPWDCIGGGASVELGPLT